MNRRYIDANPYNQQIKTGAGNDLISTGMHHTLQGEDDSTDADWVDSGAGSDIVLTGFGRDIISAGDGDDFVMSSGWGYAYNDEDHTGQHLRPEATWVRPGMGDNWGLFNGSPNGDLGGWNVAYGGRGDDVLLLGSGNDGALGWNGADMISGGVGNDEILGYGYYVPDTTQWLNTFDFMIYRNSGNDDLDGGEGNDVLLGQGGDDILRGDQGDDRLYGDDADILAAGDPAATATAGNYGANAEYSGKDYLDGGDGDDKLVGGAKDDQLFGGLGDNYRSSMAVELCHAHRLCTTTSIASNIDLWRMMA